MPQPRQDEHQNGSDTGTGREDNFELIDIPSAERDTSKKPGLLQPQGRLAARELKLVQKDILGGAGLTIPDKWEGDSFNCATKTQPDGSKLYITTPVRDPDERESHTTTSSIAEAMEAINRDRPARKTKIIMPFAQGRRKHWTTIEINIDADKKTINITNIDPKSAFSSLPYGKEEQAALDAIKNEIKKYYTNDFTITTGSKYLGKQGLFNTYDCGRFQALITKAAIDGINPEDISQKDFEDNFKRITNSINYFNTSTNTTGNQEPSQTATKLAWDIETLEKAALRHARAAVRAAVSEAVSEAIKSGSSPSLATATKNLDILLRCRASSKESQRYRNEKSTGYKEDMEAALKGFAKAPNKEIILPSQYGEAYCKSTLAQSKECTDEINKIRSQDQPSRWQRFKNFVSSVFSSPKVRLTDAPGDINQEGAKQQTPASVAPQGSNTVENVRASTSEYEYEEIGPSITPRKRPAQQKDKQQPLKPVLRL